MCNYGVLLKTMYGQSILIFGAELRVSKEGAKVLFVQTPSKVDVKVSLGMPVESSEQILKLISKKLEDSVLNKQIQVLDCDQMSP